MGTAVGLTFIGIEAVLIALAGLAIVRTGFIRLDSWIGIGGDGIPPGRAAPSWSLPDIAGHLRVTPARDHWQLLIFTDRSLVGLPQLAIGIRNFAAEVEEVEVLLLSRDSRDLCEATVQGLHLQVPIVPVDQAFYNRFWVRVMPFAFLLNPHGIVRWLGLVNTEAQLFHMWRMGQAMDHDAA